MQQAKYAQKSTLNKIADFSVELLKNTMTSQENILISPVSLLAVLVMAMRGAKGNTLRELEEVIGTDAETLSGYFASFFADDAEASQQSMPEKENVVKIGYRTGAFAPWWLSIINSIEEGKRKPLPKPGAGTEEPVKVANPLKFANSIWVKEDAKVDFESDFFDQCSGFDYAEIFKAPFNDETCQRINKWVSEHTDNEIPEIIDSFNEDDILYLINALLFDAKWDKRYDEDDIIDHEFKNSLGDTVKAKFMAGNEEIFLRDTNAKGFIKGYQGGRYEFIALLPNEGVKLSEYVSALTGERLLSILDDYEKHPVDTLMPKFEAEYKADFNPVLKEMGIKEAFNKYTADFKGIGTPTEPEHNICIGDVKQISKIKVDENGTKAVAVTSISTNCMVSCLPPRPYKVYLDRPFLYIIFDTATRMPVFLGMLQKLEK